LIPAGFTGPVGGRAGRQWRGSLKCDGGCRRCRQPTAAAPRPTWSTGSRPMGSPARLSTRITLPPWHWTLT